MLDSGEPSLDYQDFLDGEIRYDALKRFSPEEAQALFQKAASQAKERYRCAGGGGTVSEEESVK